MIIRFKNEKLKKILTNDRLIRKEYNLFFRNIKARMSELQAVKNLSLISHKPPPRRHKLKGYENCYAVDLSRNYRLVFCSTDKSIIELEEIKDITIIGIEDYH